MSSNMSVDWLAKYARGAGKYLRKGLRGKGKGNGTSPLLNLPVI